VFAMADPHDAVIPVIEKLQKDFPVAPFDL